MQRDMALSRPKRLYQVWKGSNIFFCGGRLIFGPDVASLFLTMLLIAGPAVAFASQTIIKICQRAGNHEGADEHSQILGYPVLVVTIVVTVMDLIFLLLTSSRDPGIVPRNARPPESDEAFDVTSPSMEWVHGRTPHLRLPRTKDVLVNGFTVKVKYCDTCLLYRPPRASHCSICNNCVQKFDHHCPWVGQCIGLRNYRFFFLFISSSTFLCISIFTLSWLNILGEKKNYDDSLWKSMKGEIISLVLIGYTFISVWFVGGLTVFHGYLISTNQTTYENFRYRYDKNENPYNKGILRNFKDLFFSKIPPSMNNFRSWASEESGEIRSAPNTGIDVIIPKEKFDIEMGSQHSFGSNIHTPSILQNLDYSSFDNNLKDKNRHERSASDTFAFPVIQETISQGSGDFDQSSIGADQRDMDDRIDDGRSSGTSSNGTLALLDHDIHSQQT